MHANTTTLDPVSPDAISTGFDAPGSEPRMDQCRTSTVRKWTSIGRRNATAGNGRGNGGVEPPKPMPFLRIFDENEHLAVDAKGKYLRGYDFIDLWLAAVDAAARAGLLTLAELGLARRLVGHSTKRGKPVQVSHRALAAGLVSDDTIGNLIGKLTGLGFLVRQRLPYSAVSGKVVVAMRDARTNERWPLKDKHGNTIALSGWNRTEDQINLFRQPVMTGFRIPVDVVQMLKRMETTTGSAVIPEHEASWARKATDIAGGDAYVDRGKDFYAVRRAHIWTVRQALESDQIDADVLSGAIAAHGLDDLLAEVPSEHRTAVRHQITAWLRYRAQRRVCAGLSRDSEMSDAELLDTAVHDRVRAWAERFMRRRRSR